MNCMRLNANVHGWNYTIWCTQNHDNWSRLQKTRETAANTFRGCLAWKNHTARELPTHISHFILFSFKYIFLQENPFDFVFLPLLVQNGSKRDTRNLSHEVTTATWINLYTRFSFLACFRVANTFRRLLTSRL